MVCELKGWNLKCLGGSNILLGYMAWCKVAFPLPAVSLLSFMDFVLIVFVFNVSILSSVLFGSSLDSLEHLQHKSSSD